jgi:phosphoglycolate phosphatase
LTLVIFDLDGTLVDSTEDIARSVNELLRTLDRVPLPTERIRSSIGHGVGRLLERALGKTAPEELARAEERYLAIYRRRLLETTRAYPGVAPALASLEQRSTLAVLTNKPRHESLLILEGLGLGRFFRSVYGGDSFPRRKPDPVGVTHLLAECGAAPDETLFVGDSTVDLETARNAAVRSCLVVYRDGAAAKSRPDDSPGLRPDFEVADLRDVVPLVDTLRSRASHES